MGVGENADNQHIRWNRWVVMVTRGSIDIPIVFLFFINMDKW